MRLQTKDPPKHARGDLTPMIDMTFQLIAFFMVLINFTEAEVDQRITLPSSELAKPPDQPLREPRTLQLTDSGTVLFVGHEVTLAQLKPLLIRERQILERTPNTSPAAVTMIIRADTDAPSGQVQRLMQLCQESGFENFKLRVKQREVGREQVL